MTKAEDYAAHFTAEAEALEARAKLNRDRAAMIHAELARLGPEEVARRRKETAAGNAKIPEGDIRYADENVQATAEANSYRGPLMRFLVGCEACIHHGSCDAEKNYAYFDDVDQFFGYQSGRMGCVVEVEPRVSAGVYSRFAGSKAGKPI